ncbi:UDP-N-acetylmuramoyl-L-alanyl-D-glutamate--2,6-diaminopimelate ligase [Caviibacter abscessus]|uniref:UDP-N-acetylmuramoyl-L-alanyl-D-glutamate--2, 6-diaminopimelate ligase n=1 Tax=Caviibacter abscessus TaxID=1766719 RepID=UPI00082FB8D1|nr:UDP-N-acetylmuramoyl-L-alanyl-D-glutamate--2,6-diaminopimelate ligase [Caviibacter abscessus]
MFKDVKYEILQKGLDFEFKSISYDSREITSGDIFVAMHGTNVNGNDYISKAIENGAVAVITDDKTINITKYENISFYYVENLRHNLGIIASNLYDFPQNKLKVIGVTGTNGKTTSTYILESVLENSSRVGTTGYRILNENFNAKNTTPESLDLIKLMDKSVKLGVEYFFMEVSSHSLSMGRVDMLNFDSAIFTNLTQDHLDYHKTIEDYFNAKCKIIDLLKPNAKLCVNIDDKYVKTLNGISISTKDKMADIYGEILEYTNNGMKIRITSKYGIKEIVTKLVGEYNLHNILGVVASLTSIGIDFSYILDKISKMESVVGRFELIENDKNARIVIDYAHTPDGLINVLSTLKKITQNRLITVFGAGGDRDRTKRPLMAKAAAKYSDYIILTSDNPRTEDPKQILADVEKGLTDINYTNYIIIENRSSAINHAVNMILPNDSVIIAGKGHETYQIIGKEILHFSDKEEVKKSLK